MPHLSSANTDWGAVRILERFPTNINIVCFRFDRGGPDNERLKSLDTKIMLQRQENRKTVQSGTIDHSTLSRA